jgi:hypothetical protein
MAVAFTIRFSIVVPFSRMWSNAGAARRLPGMMPPIKLVMGAVIRGADALIISDRGDSEGSVDLLEQAAVARSACDRLVG